MARQERPSPRSSSSASRIMGAGAYPRCWYNRSMTALVLIGALLAAEDAGVFEQARQVNNEAQVEYELGHFQRSLELYEKAYKLRPIPGLLFNVAQCHRKLGQLKEAA